MDWTLLAYLFCFAVSLGVSLAITPWMVETAHRIGLVDRPDGRLKVHEKPVAYMGGITVFVSFLVGFSPFAHLDRQSLALLLGGNLVVLLGFLDDMGNLPPRTKLLGQTLAVLVVMKAGIAIKIAFLPPVVSLPLSFLWLLGLTNAFNIIDIMDGLSAGVGAIAAFFLTILALAAGQKGLAFIAIALLGALLGLLMYNSHPARIFLGDAGSLFIGFMLGALGMTTKYSRNNHVALLAPILILGVPIFDTLFVMMVRWMRGIPVMKGSPDHFAIRLRKWKLSVRQTIGVSYGAAFLLGLAALAMVFGTETTALVLLGTVSALILAVAVWLKRLDMTL
ncbi:MAG TPA: undecaprenyl/decaprenyl-phosphate alpha-N-acetylglucosaminyl 1-phosphate transferase [Proteobacteria bacterium]|nr:putative undecaprenyl-phosphate N-acetylglucosaminyl 1-phosphate transferase [bacterium BMS3Abin14]HDL52873.1 undecaprenyl/decaprenyl-phosphate alpha-N-acetylglucosaminyl 1-phosphate transferase [Pseudomonadota bacterium]